MSRIFKLLEAVNFFCLRVTNLDFVHVKMADEWQHVDFRTILWSYDDFSSCILRVDRSVAHLSSSRFQFKRGDGQVITYFFHESICCGDNLFRKLSDQKHVSSLQTVVYAIRTSKKKQNNI